MTELPPNDLVSEMARQYEVERFYTEEAAMLDERRFEEWIALFDDDARYFMPIRRTRSLKELDSEFTKPGEIAFFDDTREMLASRLAKLGTGRSWSEDPPSRTRHLITNIRVLSDDGAELRAASNFHVHRTRLVEEEDNWFGHRVDTLRRVDGALMIASRDIYIEQTVLTSPNLTVFF